MAEKKAVRQTVKAKSEQEGQKMVKAKSEHKGQKTMLPPGPADSDPRFLTLDALFAKVRHLWTPCLQRCDIFTIIAL